MGVHIEGGIYMVGLLLFLLQLFLRVSSVIIFFITLYYIIGLVKFIYDAFDYFDKEAIKFGIILLIIFLLISIPANLTLFYVIW